MERKEPLRDWSPAEIREAIKAKGLPICELVNLWGVSKGSLYNAMKSSGYQSYEDLIAAYLGLAVADIWPERVAIRWEIAERRAQSLLEAKALAARQVA